LFSQRKESPAKDTEISVPFALPQDSNVGHMLYNIVSNEFMPSKEEEQIVDYDQNDWNESALFEFAYGET